MWKELLNSSYFALFLIVALGFMLGRIKVRGISLDFSAVIFIALLFGHFGVSIPKELGNFGLVLFIFTIGIQAGPGFFDSFRAKGKTLILITLLIVVSAALTAVGAKYAFRATRHFKKKDGTPFTSDVVGISCDYWDEKAKIRTVSTQSLPVPRAAIRKE